MACRRGLRDEAPMIRKWLTACGFEETAKAFEQEWKQRESENCLKSSPDQVKSYEKAKVDLSDFQNCPFSLLQFTDQLADKAITWKGYESLQNQYKLRVWDGLKPGGSKQDFRGHRWL